MERRTQADRDAVTIEIGYALLSAAVAGALVFGAVAGPKLMFALPYAFERGLLVAGASAGAVVFVLRVVAVLWRFGGGADQPSQPGRTRPDS
ncbi:DUF6332 family protein [Streptomyces xantholiticus]|uniref:DUF6332 family protein n=1 Tax=Streptomyces xantholiticus TaxID=68285 RepID=UPI001671B546|nr:DUF6332 family protein [Streptomyces xantholiticus]GGW36864.1 hypothetical protein GCM10010381_21910 [Streptomyces xantholiticus]